MSEQRDKFLTEAMGECWHELVPHRSMKELYVCTRCGVQFMEAHTTTRFRVLTAIFTPNFSTWGGFGKLWEWAQKQKWWKAFSNKMYCGYYSKSPNYPDQLAYDVINPNTFADAVYKFLKEKR